MIKFQIERLSYCRAEIEAQFWMNAKDVKDYTPADINIDWATYTSLEDIGAMMLVTARDEEKELVGYVIFVINRHLHHQEIFASSTITYVNPNHRVKHICSDMLDAAESFLRRRKVHTMVVAVTKTADISRMLKRKEFRFVETNYAKEL